MPASRRIIVGPHTLRRAIPTFRQYLDEKLDYEFLFADRLETGETIASVAVEQDPADGVTVSNQSNTTTTATVYLTGGLARRAYTIIVRATTNAAVPRKYEGVMRLEVLARE